MQHAGHAWARAKNHSTIPKHESKTGPNKPTAERIYVGKGREERGDEPTCHLNKSYNDKTQSENQKRKDAINGDQRATAGSV
jgi:hypothetical protein